MLSLVYRKVAGFSPPPPRLPMFVVGAVSAEVQRQGREGQGALRDGDEEVRTLAVHVVNRACALHIPPSLLSKRLVMHKSVVCVIC